TALRKALGRNERKSELYAQCSCLCIHRRHSGHGAGTGFRSPARSRRSRRLKPGHERGSDAGLASPRLRPPLRCGAAPLQLAVLFLLAALSVSLLAALLSVWRSAVLNALHQTATNCFMTISQGFSLPFDAEIFAFVAALLTHRYGESAGGGWRLGEKKMRHLLTTLAAAGSITGLGLEVAPAPVQAARCRTEWPW